MLSAKEFALRCQKRASYLIGQKLGLKKHIIDAVTDREKLDYIEWMKKNCPDTLELHFLHYINRVNN